MSRSGVVGAAIIMSLVSMQAAFADPPPIDAYASLPAIAAPRLSPDGETLALIAPVKGVEALVTRKVDGSKTTVLNTGETQPDWFRWKTDSRLAASVRFTAY